MGKQPQFNKQRNQRRKRRSPGQTKPSVDTRKQAVTLFLQKLEDDLVQRINEELTPAGHISELLPFPFTKEDLGPEVKAVPEHYLRLLLAAGYHGALKDVCAHTHFKHCPMSKAANLVTIFEYWGKTRSGYPKEIREYLQHLPTAILQISRDPVLSKVMIGSYGKVMLDLVRKEVKAFLRDKSIKDRLQTVLLSPGFRTQDLFARGLNSAYLTSFVPSDVQEKLSEYLSVEPKNEYPEARELHRRFILHIGGTNTGKTYDALQALKNAPRGVYLAPLRLLALEVQETMMNAGVPCSMVTGEEEDFVDGAKHISSTVEKLNTHKRYDVAVIDECQMIADEQRGYAWTRAILGVNADTIHLCLAPEAKSICIDLITQCGDTYEVVEHQRKVPLQATRSDLTLSDVQDGDALVCFSRKSVFQLAEELRNRGKEPALIYGALPYTTRKLQMHKFASGEAKVLVATDAIGMGLNLPIRRIIFTEEKKYDGRKNRVLLPEEVRQIAGRAGRYGKYDMGYFGRLEGLTEDIEKIYHQEPKQIKQARLGFTDYLLSAGRPVADVLRVWGSIPAPDGYVRMDVKPYITRIRLIEQDKTLATQVQREKLSQATLLKAAAIPFDDKDWDLQNLFVLYMKHLVLNPESTQHPLPIPEVDMFHRATSLDQLEGYYKGLSLYYSFSATFGFPFDNEWIRAEKDKTSQTINTLLQKQTPKKKAKRTPPKPQWTDEESILAQF